jgi:hypothetical protein
MADEPAPASAPASEAPKIEEAASIKPIREKVVELKLKLAKAKSQQGQTFSKYERKYRLALKRLKRTQRKLKKEVFRVSKKEKTKKAKS